MRILLLTLMIVAASPATAFDFNWDYVLEERALSLEACENSPGEGLPMSKDFYCGMFFALSNVLVSSGMCQKMDGSWTEGRTNFKDVLCVD